MGQVKDVLHAIARAEATATRELPYSTLPPELCEGVALDLRRWSMLFGDQAARTLAAVTHANVERHVAKHFDAEPDGPTLLSVDDGTGTKAPASAQRTNSANVLALTTGSMPKPTTREDWRRAARREAAAAQTAARVADARLVAYSRAREAVGVREVCVGGATRLGDGGVHAVAQACPLLSVLDVSAALRLTDVGLRSVALHCPRLTKLDVGGCSNLKGAGLAALGQTCKGLEWIRLSGCSTAVCGWALAALVSGCGSSLRHLDVSHCALLTDADCGALAKHCPQLKALSLADCRQTGDEACVVIAGACAGLEVLDLSRTELPHRVSDVALLAVAEGCGKALRELNLQGCACVTDVGVSWLAIQAGATLEILNLRGCVKVTNAGCRALADHCHALRKVDLHGARRVTDVGVRVLGRAFGARLEFLDCAAMHLLTDGADRGFGFEGLLALSRDATALQTLHLDGCFQVGDRSLKALASHGLSTLNALSLAGCPRLTAEGLGQICAVNANLQKLSLACCGDCVGDGAVVAVAKGARRLRHLVLRDCSRWGLAGMKAIARYCRDLERLDLTGCVGVDDEAVAQLAEARFKRPFRHLLLAHCPKFGDVGLAWLAEGPGGADLVTLALFKTCCTTNSLNALKDKFGQSDLRRDAFLGFWPKPRWEHRIDIFAHANHRLGVVRVQSGYRAFQARKDVAAMRQHSIFVRNLVLLQQRVRKWRAFYFVDAIRVEKKTRHDACIVIQSLARVYFAKFEASVRRVARDHRICVHAATKIEAAWRALGTRRRVAILRAAHEAEKKRRRLAGREIQRLCRGRRGRIEAARRRKLARLKREERARCATRIEKVARGTATRRVIADMRFKVRARALVRDAAARLLQRRAANLRTRVIVKRRRSDRDRRKRAAFVIQRMLRLRRDALIALMAQAERERLREDAAARRVQGAERARCARRALEVKKAARRDVFATRRRASITVQKRVRGIDGRAKGAQHKEHLQETKRALVALRVGAASRMAAGYRGRQGRLRASADREGRRARWKEMFDDDSQRPFFYDQVTGEIRWRRPQDLLELMKRPICSNCAYFEATLECGDCAEFFCDECHGQIHYGGKRSTHVFRSLYDFYGKRVDHGDGEFQSMWPSELLQDDAQGVLLRIAPHREPAETLGLWQRYEDLDASMSYYYNPVSGEGSYDEPRCFAEKALQLQQQDSLGSYDSLDETQPSGMSHNQSYAGQSYASADGAGSWLESVHDDDPAPEPYYDEATGQYYDEASQTWYLAEDA
ncbi:hypothetical protein M885DRAFT_589059 [Pelagophyceae sp. CCMP2097]|nr:hypothetical protein M885DRAFT_589059 [Pelagophyceae sp. CCMP2097]